MKSVNKEDAMPVQESVKRSSASHKVRGEDKKSDEIYEILAVLLADVQALYIKTRGFHWNIEDPRFYFLHKLFNDQYEALEEDADTIAERIRQIGRRAPGSFQEFKQLNTLKEVTGEFLTGNQMIENLVADYDLLSRKLTKAIERTTELGDFGTADLFTQILREFDKTAWMLRSHL